MKGVAIDLSDLDGRIARRNRNLLGGEMLQQAELERHIITRAIHSLAELLVNPPHVDIAARRVHLVASELTTHFELRKKEAYEAFDDSPEADTTRPHHED